MDTKLKKSNPLVVWLAFFIGINLIIASTISGIFFISQSGNINFNDYKETENFKNIINLNFNLLTDTLKEDEDYIMNYGNLSYFGSLEKESNSGKQVIRTNIGVENHKDAVKYFTSRPKEYNYIFIWDGYQFSIINNNKTLNLENDEIYSLMVKQHNINNNKDLSNYKIVMGVKSELNAHYGEIYHSYLMWKWLNWAIPAAAAAFIIGCTLLIFSSVKRVSRKEYSRKLANISGRFWLEIKILISFILLFVTLSIASFYTGIISLFLIFWWACLMLLDLYVNRIDFFKNNSIMWLIKIYKNYEDKKPFQRAMLMRFLMFICIEAVLILFTFFAASDGSGFLCIIFIALGIYLFYIYLREYSALINDIGLVVGHTELIRNGDLNTKLLLSETSPLHKTAEDLSNIQEGVFTAVQEQLKSERMKIELITNVSHDLKTPLTAIVNYIDLLSQEKLSPEHANDYVKVLNKKAARLTSLTQDIFDISKAQSGNLELNIEKIDIVELIKQSIAELDEKIKESTLSFRINLPGEKVYINADGKKLYRVFDNLISNILKYSLNNTRVYIELLDEADFVSLSFKNIASYELNMSAEDLMERFVRGDESRTTEGSGLGLAIVQSFVSLCGGSFELAIDGDLFKAVVKFRKA